MKKRIHFSLFCIVLLLTGLLGSTLSFAAGTTAGGAIPSPTVENTTNAINTVSIKKELIFINDAGSDVREPNITYSYRIEPVTFADTDDVQVTDAAGVSGKVKSGVAAALPATTTQTIVFSDDNALVHTSAAGAVETRYVDFAFTPAEFPGPGIYRYVITETSTDKDAVGVEEEGAYGETRYLDVYVRKTAEDDDTPVIYGYVLFEDTATTSFNAASNPTENIDMKSSGFVNKPDPSTGTDLNGVDVYRTQNLTITKETAGLLADKGHNFPIDITFAKPADITEDVLVNVTLGGNATLEDVTTDATLGDYITLGDAFTGTVDNGSSITFIGVPQGTTFSIVETNDTPDSYKVKMLSGTTVLLAESIVPASGSSATWTNDATLDTTTEVTITNTLDTISPTGFITRFAPYVLLLAGGILLIVLGRTAVRRSSKKQEA
ncbi:MAG: hypothetical protein IK125_04865 [Lachnospiraceae bacterium]|nr:hypothetical protein [Lachnospiraceae bacterium]